MEENRTYEVIENTEETAIAEVNEGYEESETSDNGLVAKLAVGAVIAAAGVGALLFKNRHKFEERQIRKLEKKGYVIRKKDDCEGDKCVDYVEVFDENDPDDIK